MDNYSYAELTEFMYLALSSMDTQFQYWITVTFAAVVAGFVAGKRLTRALRILVATLYLLASIILIVRFAAVAQTLLSIRDFLEEADAIVVLENAVPLGALRMPLFVLGTVAALYFLICQQGAQLKVDRAE